MYTAILTKGIKINSGLHWAKDKKIHLFESHTAMYYNPFENSNLNFQPTCYMYIVNLCSVVKFYIKL